MDYSGASDSHPTIVNTGANRRAATLRAFETCDGFDVFREWHQIICGERAEAQLRLRSQARGVVHERLEPAAHVHETFGRVLAQVVNELGIEAFTRRMRS
jgi:hypothetical protein